MSYILSSLLAFFARDSKEKEGNDLRKILIFSSVIFLSFLDSFYYSQTTYNVVNGVTTVTACSATIYDNGGTTNYSNSQSGTLIIRPTSSDQVITVTGTYSTESTWDFLRIDEGEDSNPSTGFASYSGSGTIIPFTTSGPGIPLVIHFTSDGSTVNTGFNLTITCSCAKPTAITLTATNAPCGGTGSVTVNTVTGPDNKPWVMTTFENDALPLLPWLPTPAPNAFISGNTSLQTGNNNMARLTTATNSLNGALVFEGYGENQAELQGFFDIFIDDNAVGDGSADGLAFSYGPNIATLNPTATLGDYETGVGDGLRLSFDTYNSGAALFPNCNGTNLQNVYLIYNNVTLACFSNTNYISFRGTQNLVSFYISPTGLFSASINIGGTTTQLFNAVQLPASYLSDNKSNWRAALTARTGGVNDRHRVDNINLYHFYEYEYSMNGTTWQASSTFTGLAAGLHTMYVRLKGTTTCSFTQAFTISTPVPVIPSISGASNLCSGTTTTLIPDYPTGGTVSNSGGYRIHTFTGNGTLTVPTGLSGQAEVLVVGGGGGGGGVIGGGGGAGGLQFSIISLTPGAKTVVIGAGGQGGVGWDNVGQQGGQGGNSQFDAITVIGGGGGGIHGGTSGTQTNLWNGGSGGGGGNTTTGFGTGTVGQGQNGGTGGSNNGGGGGGFNSAGTNGLGSQVCCTGGTSAGNGGQGIYFSQFTGNGSPAGWYAGGGGGGTRTGNGIAGIGGNGGGTSGTTTTTQATNSPANTGGGGGGGGYNSNNTIRVGGNGGSGIVIARYFIGTPTWASSNTAVATVDANGVVTGLAAGTSNITYSIPTIGPCTGFTSTFTITVIANTTTAPSSSPTVCVNTALSPAITMTTTGATGIGAPTGLPAGVTASWSANTITISGTPTASGTFNYSIPLTGGCGTVSATGTIIVNPTNTTTTISPSFCAGTALTTNNTMTTTGATGIGTATGLPTGVTASWAANTITLSGTPSATGPFNYTIPLTGGCGPVSATGTITIIASNQITGASSPAAVCVNNSIATVNFSTGTLTGISVSGLPTGVSLNSTQISGTPTVAGIFNYTISSTEGCTATATITVNALNAITLTSASGTNNQPVCKNSLLTNITYATTSATGATVTGLPAGVTGSWSAGVFTISGTPTAPGTFNYTITTTGGCVPQVTATGTIIVNDSPPAATVTAPFNYCSGTPIVFTISGQAGSTITYTGVPGTPASPISLVGNTTTVTVSGQTSDQTMTITSIASNGCTTNMSLNRLVPVSNCTTIPACDVIAYRVEDMTTDYGAASATNQPYPARISICDFNTSLVLQSTISAPFSTSTNRITNQYGPTTLSQNLGHMNTYNGYIGVPGYNEAVGTTTLINSSNRATNILNANTLITGRVEHSTMGTNPFTSGSTEYRSAVPIDSVRFYCVGTGSTNPGIYFFNGSNFVLINSIANAKVIDIFNGQLYCLIDASGTSPIPIVYAVGLGLPASSATLQTVATTTISSLRPKSFSISPDGTILYITANSLSGSGITKYYRTNTTVPFTICSNGTSNNANPSPTANLLPTAQAGFNRPISIAVDYSNSPTNTIYVTLTNQQSGSSAFGAYLGKLTETGGFTSTATWTSVGSNFVQTPTNTKLMGIDLAPTVTIKFITASPACVGQTLYVNASAIQSSIGTLTYRWYRLRDASNAFISSDPAYYDYYNALAMTASDGTGFDQASFTPTSAGYYFVQIIGNGTSGACSKTNSTVVKVSTGTNITANISTPSTVICSGGSTNLTALVTPSNAPSPTYLWSTGATTQVISVSTNNVYTVTITSGGVCSAIASQTITTTTTPNPPTIGTITQPTCATATGGITINGLPASGTWNLTGTPSGSVTGGTGASTTLTGLTAGQSYTFTVTQNGCTSSVSNAAVLITQPVTPTAPTIGTITQPTCTVATGSVILNGLPSSGTWTITSSPTLTIPSGTGTTTTISGLAAGTIYTFTVTNADGCTSTVSANASISAQPITPTPPGIGAITQATCSTSTGSVALTGLPSSGTWTVTGSPSGSATGTGTTGSVIGLTAGTNYTFTVTNAAGCTSSASANAILTAAPLVPNAPIIGTITHPTCPTPTGTIALSSLPSGAWTITGSPSGNATGSGTTTSISGLAPGTTYTFTVTSTSSGCTSVASSNAVVNGIPSGSSAPIIGTITQPSCIVTTASVALSGLPSGTWTVTGSQSGSATGTGTSTVVTGLAPNQTYTFTVTDANGCVSTASLNAVVNDIPSGSSAPTIGTIIQPTCTVPTGSITLTDLPSGTWTITGFPNGGATGTGTSITLSGFAAGTNYVFIITDANNCTSSTSAPASLNNQPTAPTISASAGACAGSVAPINVTATGGLAPYDVSWTGTTTGNPSGSEIAISGNSYAITGLGSGTYNVTITDANSCTAVQNSITITCASCTNPTIDTQPSPITECIGGTQTVSIAASGTSLTYQWYSNTSALNTGGTLLTGETNATYTPPSASPGTTYYYVIINSSTCATTSNAVTVVVNANNTALAASSSPSICLGLAIPSVTIATTGATGIGSATGLPTGVSASWSGDVITINGTPSASGTFNYSIPLTGGCGTVNAIGTITVTPANTAGLPSTNPTVCLGTAISPNITITTTGATGIGAATDLPSGVSATWLGNTITISGTPTALGTFNYSIPLNGGCGTVDAIGTITVTNPPSAPIIGALTQPNCSTATGSVAFSGLPIGGTWTITGTPSGSLTNSGTTATISGLTASTSYTFTVTFGGCTSGASTSAVINAQPLVPTAITLDLIQPTCTDLGVIKVLTPAAGAGITFTVTGTNPVVAANTSNNAIFPGITPGVYSVTASNGTCSTAAVTCTINPQPSTPTISGTASTCINSTTQLTGSPTAAVSSPWTSSNSGVATVSNTGLVSGVATGTTTITYTNTDGCTANVSVTISDIIDYANLQSPPNGTICVGGTFDIYGQFYNTGTVNTVGAGVAATGVIVEFGYGPTNSNPNTWTNWSTATFNPGGGGSNNDEYMGTFTGLPTGTYYYAFRYQINGCGWQYGGYSGSGGGFWNGTSNVSGVLTVNAAPQIIFISPP